MPDWLFWILVIAGGIVAVPVLVHILIWVTVAITAIILAIKK